jgi:uncharacterized protein (DUF952 family)
MMIEEPLLHVAIADDWEPARRFGEYEASTRGLTLDEVGYIHATTEAGLPVVLDDVYGDMELPLVVVVIDGDVLQASGIEVVADDSAVPPMSSWKILGALPMDSDVILGEISLRRIDGRWAVPDLTAL